MNNSNVAVLPKRKGFSNKIEANNQESKILLHNVKIDQAFNKFIQSRKNMNLKERSIKDHQNSFRYFKNYLFKYKPKIKTMNDVTYEDIQDYITYLREKKVKWDNHPDFLKRNKNKKPKVGLAAGAINKRLRDMRAQFNFWYKQGYVKNDIASQIEFLKVEKKSLNLTAEHIQRVLAQFDKKQEQYTQLRDYVILLLLIECPPRITQLLSIKMEHVNLVDDEIFMPAEKSKTGIEMVIPFTKETKRWVRLLMEQNKNHGFNDGPLFLSTKSGNQISDSAFRKTLNKMKKRAGIPSDVDLSPHKFRNFFANWVLDVGANDFDLQSMLGHKTLDATRHYVNQNKRTLKSAHKKYSPAHKVIS